MVDVDAAGVRRFAHAVQAEHAVIVDRDDCAPELERYLDSRGIGRR